MNREFLLNILFLIFINLLVKPFFIFGIDLGVQNRVGPEVYGGYFTLLSFTFIFQMLNDFGIQNFNNTVIARHPQLLPKYFPNLLIIKGLFSFGYLVLTLILALVWGFRQPAQLELLGWLAVNQVLVALLFFLRSNVSGLGFFRTDSLLSALDKLLAVGLMSWLLWARPFAGPLEIREFALAQTASLVLTAGACFWVLRGHLRGLTWRFRRPLLFLLIKKSAPFALVILLMTACTRLDVVLLERLLPDGPEQAGIYGNGYRMLDAANMVGFLFATLLLPMFSQLLSRKEAIQPLLSLAFRILMAGAVSLCAVVFFNRMEISAAMSDHSTPFWGHVLGIVIWIFVPVCVNYSFGTLLTANGSLRKMSAVFAAGLVLNIGLNLVFIPIWKAAGAAAASLITQILMAAAQIFLAQKELDLKFRWQKAASFFAFFLATMAANFFLFELENWSWIQKSAAGLAAGGAAAFLFNWLKISDLHLPGSFKNN